MTDRGYVVNLRSSAKTKYSTDISSLSSSYLRPFSSKINQGYGRLLPNSIRSTINLKQHFETSRSVIVTLPFRENPPLSPKSSRLYPGNLERVFGGGLPFHTNQLGLGKRHWNLEDLFSGSRITAFVPIHVNNIATWNVVLATEVGDECHGSWREYSRPCKPNELLESGPRIGISEGTMTAYTIDQG